MIRPNLKEVRECNIKMEKTGGEFGILFEAPHQ
jgi:hypothetical protein